MKTKSVFFGLVVVLAIFFNLVLISCDSGDSSSESTSNPDTGSPAGTDTPVSSTETYNGTSNGISYTLVISPPADKAVHAVGDTYILTVKSGSTEKISTGMVVSIVNNGYGLQPSYNGASIFGVYISGSSITAIIGIITFTDGTTTQGPGTFTNGGGSDPYDDNDPGETTGATSWTVYDNDTWITAVNGIRSGGNNKNHVINVTGDLSAQMSSLAESIFGSATGITVTIDGSRTISSSENTGRILIIGRGQTVIIKDLKLQGYSVDVLGTFRMQGNSSITSGGIFVGGAFIMQDNAKVFGNTRTHNGSSVFDGGGGVAVAGGSFIMQDNAAVSDNRSYGGANDTVYGGGVFVHSGSFTMNGGVISGNTVSGGSSHGGGVGIYSGVFTMNGGEIFGNTASSQYISYGGGVGIYGSGNFIKTGGTIYGNDAGEGLKNVSSSGPAVDSFLKRRNATAGPNMNTDNLLFWSE